MSPGSLHQVRYEESAVPQQFRAPHTAVVDGEGNLEDEVRRLLIGGGHRIIVVEGDTGELFIPLRPGDVLCPRPEAIPSYLTQLSRVRVVPTPWPSTWPQVTTSRGVTYLYGDIGTQVCQLCPGAVLLLQAAGQSFGR